MSGPVRLPWIRRCVWMAGLIGSMTTALAQDIPGYPRDVNAFDRRELALLPKYCIHTQLFRNGVPGGNNAQQIERWTAQMGSIFHHMHHYCFGLMKSNRGLFLARDSTTRRYYLNDAITEFDYVIERSQEDFILLPEIHTKKGEVLVRLGKAPLAVFEFERAIALKPDYWPPYARLSEVHLDAGEKDKARQALEQGLQAAPDAKALRRRLDELNRQGGGARR